MPKNKTDNFLKAIKKYAGAQKKAMEGEVKQLKSERLKEAEEKAKRDSEALKKQKLNEVHNSQTAKLATKTQEGQKQLYIARAQMTEEVFKLASDKLKAYAQTAEYRAKLNDSAKAVAELFGGKDCIIYVNERDIAEAEQFKSLFSAGSEVKADKTIQIGGVKAYCESMGIIADETLDSKLDLQREWFVENAELSVL
ncbi:MAG: V-type ATP synthase subunit E [Oscillospiraceae bacterium]|jgi:vacuolar-type H+-ATPase subunit E/Vma4|uniref:V-type ATP synthase subunit E n=1 Tax=Ruminococcus sp. JL13D9 TaxID=3233381 RepID=UPI0026FBD073|nr:V-type ATP synthase subunit E [Ruminococcus sp.]MDO4881822.1 V-type ATP synthase subunit E [Oscillospiraceae bacterium]MEE1016825.1 V-type ATP synthase subunit E [Ruminococcus sp.]